MLEIANELLNLCCRRSRIDSSLEFLEETIDAITVLVSNRPTDCLPLRPSPLDCCLCSNVLLRFSHLSIANSLIRLEGHLQDVKLCLDPLNHASDLGMGNRTPARRRPENRCNGEYHDADRNRSDTKPARSPALWTDDYHQLPHTRTG